MNKPPSHGTRVLVVDDDNGITRLLTEALTRHGYDVDAVYDGLTALHVVRERTPDVVLLDVVLPGLSGYEICSTLKRDPATRLLPVVLITGLTEQAERVAGLKAGADDFLTKPIELNELLARVASLARIKRYTDDLDSAASIIMMLATMIESRDGYTHGHCHRMANYATAFGRQLSLSDSDLQALQRGGFLHDIGMLAVSDALLRREGKLSDGEYDQIKSHTIVGDSLCRNLRSLAPIRPIVRHHHERYDGSGYPDGLRGDEIPLLAQIMGIVDVYDAVTTRRPYQHVQSSDAALDVLRRQVELGWRRGDLVEEFGSMIESVRTAGPVARA
jgi:putative two-component system response regulator